MIVLLAPYKFTKYHYLIYELDLFKKNINEKIEVHDLSKITNPQSESSFRLPRLKQTKIFYNIDEWENYFKKIYQKKKLIVFNLLELNSFNSLKIHFKLSKYINTFIQLKSQGLPNIFVKKNKKIHISSIFNKMFKVIKNRNLIKLFLKQKIITVLAKFIKFEKIYYLKLGKKKNFITSLNSKKEIYIDYHSHDFSRMRYLKKKQSKKKQNFKTKKRNKRFGVFLDTPTPYFRDDYSLMGIEINYNLQKWYNDLNDFLLKAEKVFNCKIIIIPHPKVKNIKNPFYDKNFKVCNDLDAVHKLIPSAQIVFSINASTAIGLAVASQKKVILIYNNQIKEKNYKLFDECRFIAKKSNSKFLNINNFNLESLKNIKIKKNDKNYIFDYMTSKKISKKQNYEIFSNLVEKIKAKNRLRGNL